MDDALNVGILLEHILECLQVAAVHLLEGGANACNLLDAVHDTSVGVGKVVDDDDLVTCFL